MMRKPVNFRALFFWGNFEDVFERWQKKNFFHMYSVLMCK